MRGGYCHILSCCVFCVFVLCVSGLGVVVRVLGSLNTAARNSPTTVYKPRLTCHSSPERLTPYSVLSRPLINSCYRCIPRVPFFVFLYSVVFSTNSVFDPCCLSSFSYSSLESPATAAPSPWIYVLSSLVFGSRFVSNKPVCTPYVSVVCVWVHPGTKRYSTFWPLWTQRTLTLFIAKLVRKARRSADMSRCSAI